MALTFEELRAANRLRIREVFGARPKCSPCHWMTALQAELGDVAYLIRKQERCDPDESGPGLAPVTIQHALAATMIRLDQLAERLDVDLGDAVRARFNALSEERGSVVRLAETAEERIP